jgi:phosphoribosylformimino-5-aminoimidazole carboxamide ribotide isomerase
MRFRPCIDLHKGKVKQIVGATLRDGDEASLAVNFETDRSPADFARMYREDGLAGGHVIMLGPGNETAARQALAAFPGGLHVGGGITPKNTADFLTAGASHVIVTSYVFEGGQVHWERLQEISASAGRCRLVLDLSCKLKGETYFVATDRWQNLSNLALTKENLEKLARYCDEFLVHAADVEGMRAGIDEELVALLGKLSPIAVTYAGGVRSLADLDKIDELGKGRVDVTAGSALDIFGGSLPYKDVVGWHRRHAAK